MRPKKRGDSWVYPKSADVLRAARLRTIGEYIARRRQTVLRAIVDRPILEECREAERQRGIPTLQNGPVRDRPKDGLAAPGDIFPDRPEARCPQLSVSQLVCVYNWSPEDVNLPL